MKLWDMRFTGDAIIRLAMDMSSELLSAMQSAELLGIAVTSLYDWLARSDAGEFVVRGQSYTIAYFQSGARGQGRIQIEPSEIERLREAMRVRPQIQRQRRPPSRIQSYPGIRVPLGRPE